MSLYYIKGTPGSGKSTIRRKLQALGYDAHDADDKDMGGPYNNKSNQRVNYPDNPSEEWYAAHSYRLIPEAIKKLHESAREKTIFLCGTAHNEDELWYLFDYVLFLDIDKNTLINRIISRRDNDYGKAPHERKDIMQKFENDRKKRDRAGVIIIDATRPINEVIQDIINIAQRESN